MSAAPSPYADASAVSLVSPAELYQSNTGGDVRKFNL